MATIHETCSSHNDVAINNPIEGTPSIRKILAGTWTRTIVATDGEEAGWGSTGKCYGAGGSGEGILIKKGLVADGGTSSRPKQTIMIWTGEA